ncbi:MAG: hypothetical protein AAGH60_08335 [Pseudomonadota bacterium]
MPAFQANALNHQRNRVISTPPLLGAALLVLCLIAFTGTAGHAASEFMARFALEEMSRLTLAVIFLLFMVTAALPFIPGAEIGLLLLAVFGAKMAVLVYLAMVCALSLAFVAGRLIPGHWIVSALARVQLTRAARFIERFHHVPMHKRAGVFMHGGQATSPAIAPGSRKARLVERLMRHRMVVLAVLLNTPGNGLLGGGGGLSLMAGMSGLFSVPSFLATVTIAVAPVPLCVLLLG